MSDMKDWPLATKINVAADELAPTIYYMAHRVFGGNGRMFEALTVEEHAYYRDVAEALLRTVAPSERGKKLPPLLKLVETPTPIDAAWCAQCHTRPAAKFAAPYCSMLCRDAAQRAALYDRR